MRPVTVWRFPMVLRDGFLAALLPPPKPRKVATLPPSHRSKSLYKRAVLQACQMRNEGVRLVVRGHPNESLVGRNLTVLETFALGYAYLIEGEDGAIHRADYPASNDLSFDGKYARIRLAPDAVTVLEFVKG